MLGMRYAWRLLLLLIVFFFVNSMFLSQIGLFLSARFSWDGHPFGARELGWIFAYAGFINMVVQGFLITRANHSRIRPQHRHARRSPAWDSASPDLRPASNIPLLACRPDAGHCRHHVRPQHVDGGTVAQRPRSTVRA